LHDDREQLGGSFECGAIFGGNLNLGMMRGLSTLWEFFNRNFSIFQFFFRQFGVNQSSTLLQAIF